MSDEPTVDGVTWEQFRESILAGWMDCMPHMHIDAPAAWQHLLNGGSFVVGNDLEVQYFNDAREDWRVDTQPYIAT